MVRSIHLTELVSFDDKKLGYVPTEADYNELINEDCNVYLPDGTLAVAFRKQGLKTAAGIVPGTKDYDYWRWACRALVSDQRGNAAGAEITSNVEIRLTEGQKKFFNQPSEVKGDAKPDIIIKTGDDCKIIADVKYKIGSKDSDRYQVISHALSYGSNIAILVLPRNEKNEGSPSLLKLGTIGDTYKVDVYEYYYDLANTNLEYEETNFARGLGSLINNLQ